MKGHKYITILAVLQILLALTACNKRDSQPVADKEPLPLYCTFSLRSAGVGAADPNKIQPTRVMLCVVNNEGLVEAQQARKVDFNHDVTFTFPAITQGSKRLYAYAISPKGETDDQFDALNYVVFPTLGATGVTTDFDGAGVSQFAIPKFSHEYQLQDLVAKVGGHTTTDANIIYSGYSEIVHNKATQTTPKVITLYPQMSRVEVRLFVDEPTRQYWDTHSVSVTKATISFANLSQAYNFFFTKATPTKRIDTQQFASITQPQGNWSCDIPATSLSTSAIPTYGTTKAADVIVYSAPIFSSLWQLSNAQQPKVDLILNLSNGDRLAARFPISTGDDNTAVASGVVKPGPGDLYPSYNYKLDLIISLQEVSVKYQLIPWDEKTIETEPFV